MNNIFEWKKSDNQSNRDDTIVEEKIDNPYEHGVMSSNNDQTTDDVSLPIIP